MRDFHEVYCLWVHVYAQPIYEYRYANTIFFYQDYLHEFRLKLVYLYFRKRERKKRKVNWTYLSSLSCNRKVRITNLAGRYNRSDYCVCEIVELFSDVKLLVWYISTAIRCISYSHRIVNWPISNNAQENLLYTFQNDLFLILNSGSRK